MAKKPKHAWEYKNEQVVLVRSTCLYLATKLGDMMDDLLIVGGLVPSLLIDQEHLDEGMEPHVGTMDLDVGLQVALLNDKRYRQLTERLRDAGLEMDKNEAGNPTRQRWAIARTKRVTIDFLIQPTLDEDKGGTLRDLEPDFAAIIAPGLRCAFRDRKQVTVKGTTLVGEKATRNIWVCDAGGYVVLKALAFDNRGENKDAYDLYYVVRNYGSGPTDVAAKLRPLLDDADAQRALEILKRDFSDPDAIGPMRVATFLRGANDDDLQADVVGFIGQLLARVTRLD
jgi:hypothetical protein